MMINLDYTKNDLVTGLREIGINPNDVIFTQVSLGLLGRLKDANTEEQSSKILFDSFKEVLGNSGTLLVPTYTYSFCNEEIFDPQNSPSTIGSFTEFFRKQENVVRSLDPIFSVAGLGPKASQLLTNLPYTCFGKDSLYERLTKIDGKICMIGLRLHWTTYRHHIEETVNIPARFSKKFSGTIVENGEKREEEWDYYVRDLSDNCFPDGRRLEKKARDDNLCHIAKVGRGELLSIKCRDYFDLGKKELEKDPWFTVRGPPE